MGTVLRYISLSPTSPYLLHLFCAISNMFYMVLFVYMTNKLYHINYKLGYYNILGNMF